MVLNDRTVAVANTPAVATTISMIKATPARWLSTPVCNRPQMKTDIGCVPGGVARLVAGNSLSPIANAIAHAARRGRRESGNTTRHNWPQGPIPSSEPASR